MRAGGLRWANAILLGVPGALLLGALGFQRFGGLNPCEMCLWQRWPHLAAIVLAAVAWALPGFRRPLLWLAAGAVLTAGALGAFHAGVEQGWWTGPTSCSSTDLGPGGFNAAILAAPVVRCDAIAWSFAGLSLAGWNAVVSIAAAVAGAAMLARAQRVDTRYAAV